MLNLYAEVAIMLSVSQVRKGEALLMFVYPPVT